MGLPDESWDDWHIQSSNLEALQPADLEPPCVNYTVHYLCASTVLHVISLNRLALVKALLKELAVLVTVN